MTAEIKAAFPDAEVEYVKSSGGAFEVAVDGNLVFSKLERHRFPSEGEVERLLHS